MLPFVLLLALIVVVLVMSSRVRSAIFHHRVRHFLLIVIIVIVFSLMCGAGYLGWKYLWPRYMNIPVVEWTDITLEHDENPVTPGVGGPKQPTVIHVR